MLDSSMTRAIPVALLTALLAAVPASAAQHRPHSIYQSPLLWATVNVCDTPEHPDTIGIRGSIPGSGVPGEQMFVRIQAQYFSRAERRWHNILQGADSGWIAVGSARFTSRQAGWSFRFVPPGDGSSDVLRGAVTFEWRRDGKVVRHLRKRTSDGHRSATGADPAGYSASSCQ